MRDAAFADWTTKTKTADLKTFRDGEACPAAIRILQLRGNNIKR